MSDEGQRYLYSGHAIGASAQFDSLESDHTKKLPHPVVIPTVGQSVLPTIGGVSKSRVTDYSHSVDKPRRLELLSARRVDSISIGQESAGRFETEVETEIEAFTLIEKLRVDHMRLHMLASHKPGEPAKVTTKGNRIDGVHMGAVEARVILDDEPIHYCGNKAQLGKFYREQEHSFRKFFHWRFNTDPEAQEIKEDDGVCKFSLVKEIKLFGPERELQYFSVDGYTITWEGPGDEGFGKIILAEVLVTETGRSLNLLRTEMGSPASGTGSAGDGQSDGQLGN